MYKCKYCDKEFESKHSLCGHTTRCKENPKNKLVYNCKFCSREFTSLSGLHRHEKQCKCNPNRISENHKIASINIIKDTLFCSFCGKQCKNENSLRNHERMCPQNPDPSYREKFNTKGLSGHIAWNKGLTKETDSRVLAYSTTLSDNWNSGMYGLRHTLTKHSRKAGFKYGWYKDYYCDSSWELAFIIYCLDNDIHVIRNSEYFVFTTKDGKHSKFYPDFIIDDVYYEIKGGYDTNTNEKISQFPKDKHLVLIDSNKITKYLNYAESKYGKQFYTVYDKDKPSWMDKN